MLCTLDGMLSHARVLLAEDDPDMLGSVTQALRGLGADVVTATDGAELLQRLADEGPFTVIVTDVSMPWMTGLQAMHAVRYAGLGTPIVVMTALQDSRLPQDVRALGAHVELLRKPFGIGELETAIRAVAGRASHDCP